MNRDRVLFIGFWLIALLLFVSFTKWYFGRKYIFEKDNMCYMTYSCYKKDMFDFRCKYQGKEVKVGRYTRLK